MLALARELAADDPEASVLLLTGSAVSHSLSLPPNVDTVKLPSLKKLTNSRYGARNLGLASEEIIRLRERLILESFEGFAPDLLIVDKVPVGVHGELRPTLERARSGSCKVVLSLRDILDDPEEVIRSWREEGIYEALGRYYERILVWGMKEVYDVVEAYGIPPDVAERVEYCGYISTVDGSPTPVLGSEKSKRLVVATAGGGEDGFFLLDSFVRCLPFTSTSFASVVVLGPDMPDSDGQRIRERARRSRRPVFVVEYTRNLERFIEAADLVVSMGGYNTVCEVVARNRPALIVPRTQPRVEQLLRAERLEALGYLRMLRPESVTLERLARAIDDGLTSPRPTPREQLDFDGLAKAAAALARANGSSEREGAPERHSGRREGRRS
jgi:predicted glycosyltransferase